MKILINIEKNAYYINDFNRSKSVDSFFFFNSHSQIRNTVQPRASNMAVTSLSCFTFRSRFFCQYS